MIDASALVEVRDVRLNLNNRDILTGVDLRVDAGEIVTLIGPNGAGKSSLVRVVLGLLPATGGQIFRKPGLRIGYMPQRLAVPDNLPLTVRRFLSLSGSSDPARLLAVSDQTRTEHLLNQSMQTLSGGEHQRVLLARALLRDPDLLVLDEPVQGVDVTGQADLYALIARLRDQLGCGVLMVSHDLHLVMAQTDQVICLNSHVCCSGHPEHVSRHPAYLELFGNAINPSLAVYTHHHDHTHDLHGAVDPDSAHLAAQHGDQS
ncbi:MAG: zinc ABC transporter ATP-binding protein ZnuC [Gammaproteobacteria bacterium]|nr:zinc ABC transporter ATP-binding protein ZnuC [Gammaproteobacteria bacterium]